MRPLLLSFLCLLAAWPARGLAVSVYITDEIEITMRRGPGTSYRLVRVLRTGRELELIKRNDNGWDLVRTRRGSEGWVLHRFLSNNPPAKQQLADAKLLAQQAVAERDKMAKELAEIQNRMGSQESLEAELVRVKRISKNALKLEQENRTLARKTSKLEKDLRRVSDDKRILERQSDTLLFLSGAVVLILGVVSGAVMARRRRSTYGSLS